ncbi:MAG TPA: hypothetical protein VF492_11225, partial [Verrucomicrobiae bacterium]
RKWMLDIGCWWLVVSSVLGLTATFQLCAQTPPQIPPGGLSQLQVPQPPVDVFSPVNATAVFDPPVIHAGEKTFYRVTVDAAESAIAWPAIISAPAELKFGLNTHGQIMRLDGNKYRPFTAFAYEVTATAAGQFTITNFSVNISGQPVEIPAASLDVVTASSNLPPARRLVLDVSATNVFLGQPFRVRVMLPAGNNNEIEALREIQLTGDGLMTDKTTMRQSIKVTKVNGQLKPTFICELTVTPIAAGPLKFSAQGFTAGREFSGPITIRGPVSFPDGPAKYVLLVSDVWEIHVRPLPAESELPGYTGTIGKFFRDPPALSTNRIRVGEPVQLKVTFHGEGDLTRFVPPAPPRSRAWQIIADQPPGTGYTLIPQTDEVHETPAIPFSYFDPATAKYMDLTIPPLPITVVGEGLPVQLPVFDDESKSTVPLRLSNWAPTPGKTARNLKPLQLRGWFIGVQFLPVLGFLALWQWDRRRRFWEAHPDRLRRREARRALRSEKIALQKSVAANDAAAFVQHAVNAMRIAVAPHYPANPRALVCADVLAQLDDAERNGRAGETVRHIFAAVDAQFASTAQTQADWLARQPAVAELLLKLEAKL